MECRPGVISLVAVRCVGLCVQRYKADQSWVCDAGRAVPAGYSHELCRTGVSEPLGVL
jgi:hypothetical protein